MSSHNFISPDVISLLLINILNQENNPAVIYKLSKTTCKILKYKETVNTIYIDEEVLFILNTDQCDCTSSTFCDHHHKHIIEGNLRMIKEISEENC